MEHSGSYRPTSFPGEHQISKAKKLCVLPDFNKQSGHEAFFNWDTDIIQIYAEDATVLRELPLRETLKQYEEQLK